VFGDQKPKADEVAGDLIGEKLSNATLHAGRITGFDAGAFLGPLGLDFQLSCRPILIKFFLKAELFDNPLHTANTDLPAALAQFLGNNFGRSLRVEKSVSDYLADNLGRSTVISLRAAFLTLECLSTQFDKNSPQLKVALLAEAELLCGLNGS